MSWLARSVGALIRRGPGWLLRAGVVACALAALALLVVTRVSAPNPDAARTRVGRLAPTFTAPAAQGGALLPAPAHFPTANGRPALLVFFNTLCVHCLSEISAVRQAAASAPGASLDIIFVDTPGENAQITGAYMARIQFDPPVALDRNGAVAHAYGAVYGPTLILVDQRGVVRGVWVGETPASTLISSITNALVD